MIKVIDNFFNKDLLKKIQNHIVTNIYYTPRWLDGKEKTKENYYGDRFALVDDPKLTKVFVENAENKFKIKIKKLNNDSGIDLRNIEYFKPHTDPFKINILIMLSGKTSVTNGTVFYHKLPDGAEGKMKDIEQGVPCELDMHVGFRENRAIMFPSNKIHGPNIEKSKDQSRYTASLFIDDYEE